MLLAVIGDSDSDPSFGHPYQHALHQLGVLVDAARLQQMLYLGGELVNSRVAGRQLAEGDPEFQRLFEVSGPLPTSIGVNEIWNRGACPRRGDQRRDFLEEGRRQACQRIRFADSGRQQSLRARASCAATLIP